MGQEAGGERDLTGAVDVLGRGLVTKIGQGLAILAVRFLGLVSQTHQGFFATLRAPAVHPELNLLWGHRPGLWITRVFAKRAVRAAVAAEIGNRQEDFSGIRNRASLMSVAERPRRGQQRGHLVVRAVDELIPFLSRERLIR